MTIQVSANFALSNIYLVRGEYPTIVAIAKEIRAGDIFCPVGPEESILLFSVPEDRDLGSFFSDLEKKSREGLHCQGKLTLPKDRGAPVSCIDVISFHPVA